MKKATSLLLIILLSFSIILQSSALIVPYASSSNEKRIYAKGLVIYKNELSKTEEGSKIIETIDKVVENYKNSEQILAYLANKTNDLVIEQKSKKAQDVLVYLGFNANYNLAKLKENTLGGVITKTDSLEILENTSNQSTLTGIVTGPDGKLYYNGKPWSGHRGGGLSSSSSSDSSNEGGGSSGGGGSSDGGGSSSGGGGGEIDTPSPINCLDDSKLPTPKLIENVTYENPDEWFYNYRLENFAPSTESFIKELFGSSLVFEDKAFWEYNSYNSHSVGFSTNLPTISIIEYGETDCYDKKTIISDSYYYNHLHYITGLEEGKTYHYRIKAQDYDGNLIISEDHTFTTKTFTDDIIKVTNKWLEEATITIQVDGKGKTISHQITSPGTYVLVEDIVSDTLGINIKASNVIIDLNGHTLIYDNGAPTADPLSTGRIYVEDASMGIRAGLRNFVNNSIYNGIIKQGKNGGAGLYPIFLNHMGGGTRNEIAGVTIDYYSDSTPGIRAGIGETHHNVVYDRGFEIADRHSGIRAISAGAESVVKYNSIRRFRHRGIDTGEGSQVIGNELYSDSYDTNSFALGLGKGVIATDNKIFGMGYAPIGIGWGNDTYVANNFIYERCYSPNQRSDEYVRSSSIAGMRVTNYYGEEFKNMLYENNTIVLKAENGCYLARGIWTTNGTLDSNIVYKNNTIKVEAMPGNVTKTGGIYYNNEVNNVVAAVTIQGNGWTSEEISNAIIFESNHFIGNVNLVVIGEGYGISNGVRFYNNILEKIESESEYFRPIRLGFWYWNTLANKMIDNKLVNIGESEIIPHFFGGTGKMEVTYGISKTLTFVDENDKLLANKTIIANIDNGILTENIVTDNQGKATFELLTSKHFKLGNSVENGGVSGTETSVYYTNYSFLEGDNKSEDISIDTLKGLDKVVLAGNGEEENMDLLIEENNEFKFELEGENRDANLLIEEDDINSFIGDSEVDEFSNDNAIEEVENDLVDEFIKPDGIYDEIEEKLEDVLYEMEDNDFSVKEDELEEENNNE